MKFTVNCDCTPEEARRFFGLPDIDQMNDMMQDNMKTWMPQNFQAFQELQQMIWDQMGSAMMAGMPQSNNDDEKKSSGKK
jgi:hypothetical protein